MGREVRRQDADVVGWKIIEALCPRQAKKFQAALRQHGIDDFIFAQSYWPGAGTHVLADEIQIWSDMYSGEAKKDDAWRAANELMAAWQTLRGAFAEATKVGFNSFLHLGIGYTEEDDERGTGDGGEVDAVFYTVQGAYQLSPTGRKFEKLLIRVHGIWSNH